MNQNFFEANGRPLSRLETFEDGGTIKTRVFLADERGVLGTRAQIRMATPDEAERHVRDVDQLAYDLAKQEDTAELRRLVAEEPDAVLALIARGGPRVAAKARAEGWVCPTRTPIPEPEPEPAPPEPAPAPTTSRRRAR